jgi:hypothetical protein
MLSLVKATIARGERGSAGIMSDMKANGKVARHLKASTRAHRTARGATGGKEQERRGEKRGCAKGFDAAPPGRKKTKWAKNTWRVNRCLHERCLQTPVGGANGGYCKSHGGGDRCKEDGCTKFVLGKTLSCYTHSPNFMGGGQATGCRLHVIGNTSHCKPTRPLPRGGMP